jgi:hypothetical protein
MYSNPPEMMNVSSGMPFVTKLKTKIIQTMDFVLQCENDERALNGWRLLCSHGVALVRLAVNDGEFDKSAIKDPEKWKALADEIIKNWPPKTAEKTQLVPWGDRYSGHYDHYEVVINREDLQLGIESLKQEKYNVICSRLMKLWGDCYSIILVVNYLNIDEEIELPVTREYTGKSMEGDTGQRRQPKRQQSDQKPPR